MADASSVVFGMSVDLTGLRTGLAQSVSLVRSTVGRITGSFGALANPFAALTTGLGVGGLTLLIGKAASLGDELLEMSSRVGIGVERLQELQHGARLSGVSAEGLEKGLTRLNRALGEAGTGNKEAVQLFEDLGINVRDAGGGLRDAGDVIDQLADKLQATASPAERTRLVMAAFGREGARLVPLLEGGSAGLARFAEEARRLGQVLDREAVEKAAALRDEMDKLSATVSTNLTRAVLAFQGPLKGMTTLLGEAAAGWGHLFDLFASDDAASLTEVGNRLADLRTKLEELQIARRGAPSGSSMIPALDERIARIQQQLAGLREQAGTRQRGEARQPGGADFVSADQLAKIDQLRQKVLDAAIPDKTAQSIVKFRQSVEDLAKIVPSRAAEIRALGQAFEDITTSAEKAKQSMTSAQAAQLGKSLGLGEGDNLFAGFAEIDKIKTEAGQFGTAIQDLAKRGVPLRDIFDLIGKSQDALSLKTANLREQFAAQPAVLEAIRTELAGVDFGQFARDQDALVRSLSGTKQGTAQLIDTAEGLNAVWTPGMKNAGLATTELTTALAGVQGAAAVAQQSFVTITQGADAVAESFRFARTEALLFNAMVGRAADLGNPGR